MLTFDVFDRLGQIRKIGLSERGTRLDYLDISCNEAM